MSGTHVINADSIIKVRRNDSTVTSLSTPSNFRQFTDQVAHSLGRALARNNHVTSLSLNINMLTRTGNYASLLNAIENSATIEEISLRGHNRRHDVGTIVDRFLNAISSNSGIKKVGLHSISGLGTNSFLALIRSPITTLKMGVCYFADRDEQALREIAAAFRANQSLQRLEIDRSLSITIFDALENLPSLRHLLLRGIYTFVQNALVRVLSSCLIEVLELRLCHFSGAMFETLAQGMQPNHTLTTLKLYCCRFDAISTESFIRFMETNNSIRTLFLEGTHFSISRGNVMSRVLRSNSTLENLSTRESDVGSILEALEANTTVKTWDLGIVGHQGLGYLNRSLPKLLGLTKLMLTMGRDAHACPKETILLAFQRNQSLREVVIRQLRRNEYLDADALAKIRSFCLRNRELPLLLAAPAGAGSHSRRVATGNDDDEALLNNEAFCDPEVNLRLRPRAYSVAQQMERGTDMIFRDMLSLGDLT